MSKTHVEDVVMLACETLTHADEWHTVCVCVCGGGLRGWSVGVCVCVGGLRGWSVGERVRRLRGCVWVVYVGGLSVCVGSADIRGRGTAQ